MTSLTKVKAPKGSLKILLEQWTAMVERYGDPYTFPHPGHEGFISAPRYYPGVVLVLEERFRAAKLLDGQN